MTPVDQTVEEAKDFVARLVRPLHPLDHAETLKRLSETFGRWGRAVDHENERRGVPDRDLLSRNRAQGPAEPRRE